MQKINRKQRTEETKGKTPNLVQFEEAKAPIGTIPGMKIIPNQK